MQAILPNKLTALFITSSIFVILDGVITQLLLTKDTIIEGNTLINCIVNEWYFVLLKTTGAIIYILVTWYIYRKNNRMGYLLSTLFMTLYIIIVIHNISLFFIY